MAPAIKPASGASSGWAAASQSNIAAMQHVPYQETHQIKCTKPDCEKLFATERQMRKHKVHDTEHFYCYKCDVDCEDYADLIKHKIDLMAPYIERRVIATPDNMPKHIVCEFCGDDFNSIGGRTIHRQTVHPADQDIECPGCKQHFIRAANMLAHIEQGGCSGIRPYQLYKSICQKFVRKQVMRDPDAFKRNLRGLGNGVEPPEQEEGGGVSLLDQENEAELAGYKTLSSSAYYSNVSSPTPSRADIVMRPGPTSHASLPESMQAISITSATPRSKATTIVVTQDPAYPYLEAKGSAETASSSSKPSAWDTSSSASKKLFPEAEATPPKPGDWDGFLVQRQEEALADDNNNALKACWWDPSATEYNPGLFRDPATGIYTCPIPECMSDGAGFLSLSDLQDHISMFHLPSHYECPRCFKRFSKPSALVSHAESTRKCAVRETGGFKSLIDEITGGLINAKSVYAPKIYRPNTAVVKFGKQPAYGVMDTRFTGKKFDV